MQHLTTDDAGPPNKMGRNHLSTESHQQQYYKEIQRPNDTMARLSKNYGNGQWTLICK
jgi:hypothetical protein